MAHGSHKSQYHVVASLSLAAPRAHCSLKAAWRSTGTLHVENNNNLTRNNIYPFH
jgi:hypothetical protein